MCPCDKLAGITLYRRCSGEPVMPYLDYHRTVIGYHGTSANVADDLVNGKPFKESTSDNEWLGAGIYFWEYAPKQAWWWAKKACKKVGNTATPAVVGAVIRLGNCLDLLDPENIKVLQHSMAKMVESLKQEGVEIPKNERIYKNLDCAVFNFYYDEIAADKDEPDIDTTRAAYVPTQSKDRIWEASWIYKQTHIQICVRNPSNILTVWHAHPDGRYGKAKNGR
jgi:hypothetical protein